VGMEINLKLTISFLLLATFMLLVACGDIQPLPHNETVELPTLNQPLAENVTQVSDCIKKEVDVQLAKEGQPVEIVEEIKKDVRGELVKSGVSDEVIEQVVEEVHTELLKEVIEQPPAKIGKVEINMQVEVVIDESEKADDESTCVRLEFR